MSTVSFRRKLKEGKPLIGTLMQMPLPEVAEIFVAAGYDWLFVDLEHSPMDARAAINILMAADKHVPCVVRVPWNDEAYIKKALDIGATGIIVPLVNTVADAKLAVGRCKYPPQGFRSVGITRAQRFGLEFEDYMKRANDEVAVLIQIEHIEAVRNIEQILDVTGIDAVFVGPFDLSGSMDKPGEINDPEVQTAIKSVIGACEKRGIARAIYAHSPEHARTYMSQGYTVIGLCTDNILLARAAQAALAAVRA